MKGNYVSTETTRVCDVSGEFGVSLLNVSGVWPQAFPRYKSSKGEVVFAGLDEQCYGIEIVVPEKGRFGVTIIKDGMNVASCRQAENDFALDAFYLIESPKTRGKNILLGSVVPGRNTIIPFHFLRAWDRFYETKPTIAFREAGLIRVRFVREREGQEVFGRPAIRQGHICGPSDRFAIDPSSEVVEVVCRNATTALIAAGNWNHLSDTPVFRRKEPAVVDAVEVQV